MAPLRLACNARYDPKNCVPVLATRFAFGAYSAAITTDDAPKVIEVRDVKIDRARRVVTKADREVHLTPIEYKLLALLAEHAGKVLTHSQILRDVWGPTYAAQSHYVRVHMAELRKKIEDEPARPKLIVTEPGVGYRLRDHR